MGLVFEFNNMQLEDEKKLMRKENVRVSMIDPRQHDNEDELLSPKEEKELRKRLEEEMNKELEEALRKNVDFVTGRKKRIQGQSLPGRWLCWASLRWMTSCCGSPLP